MQVVETVARQRVHSEDPLERLRSLVPVGQFGHLLLDPVELAPHVGRDVAHDFRVDRLWLYEIHRRTPTVKSGALRSGKRAASAGESATFLE